MKTYFNYFLIFFIFFLLNNQNNQINCNVIPLEDQDIARGFFDGLGIRTFFNLTSCSIDFNIFVISALENLNGLATRSHGETIKAISKTLEIFGTLVDKCEGTGIGMAKLMLKLKQIFYNPKAFLSGAAKNVISIGVVAKYFKFMADINLGIYYNAGQTLGEIVNSLIDVKINGKREVIDFLENGY